MWQPISLDELCQEILKTENCLEREINRFWKLIKITPEKWWEDEYGKEAGGFWVVGICGKRVIWYNDIEDGFNISEFEIYGSISEYASDQYDLNHVLIKLFKLAEYL